MTLNGMPGYYYLYVFTDADVEVAHAHYFLFQGSRLYSLVFQTVPPEDFVPLAPLFDQIAGTFLTAVA